MKISNKTQLAAKFRESKKSSKKVQRLTGEQDSNKPDTNIPHLESLKCSMCKCYKSKDNFSKSARYSRGYDYRCKDCNKKRALEYHIDNKEALLTKWKTKRKNRSEKEKFKESEKLKKHYREHYIKIMVMRARERARTNNLECDLDESDIVLPEVCPLLGVPFIYGDANNKWYTYSLDRIDSTKGYTKDNVQVITYLANTMKNKASKKELITFAKNIIKLLGDDIV